MSDLLGNFQDRFSQVAPQMFLVDIMYLLNYDLSYDTVAPHPFLPNRFLRSLIGTRLTLHQSENKSQSQTSPVYKGSLMRVQYPKLCNMAITTSLNVFTASKTSNFYILFTETYNIGPSKNKHWFHSYYHSYYIFIHTVNPEIFARI